VNASGRAVRRQWRALHVHLPHSVHDTFLVDVLDPVLRAEGLRDDAWYLRYWQGGPHVRVRLGVAEGVLDDARFERVRQRLASGLPRLDDQHVGEYDLAAAGQAELARLEGEEATEVHPVGTVAERTYVPERTKYGQESGLAIAEDVFRETTVEVLDGLVALRASAAGTAGRRAPVGEAVRVLVGFLRGSDVARGRALDFVRAYEQWWEPYAPPAFRAAWTTQADLVQPAVDALCDATWGGQRDDDAFVLVARRATARARLAAGAPEGAPLDDLVLEGTPFAGCLANHVHTTNNRLGLVPAAEGFVAHLVARSLAAHAPRARARARAQTASDRPGEGPRLTR